MKVTFNRPQVLGNRPYNAGTQEVSDLLAHNEAFKRLVKASAIIVHPRDKAAQGAQAMKDARAMELAIARAQAGAMAAQADKKAVSAAASPAVSPSAVAAAVVQPTVEAAPSAPVKSGK